MFGTSRKNQRGAVEVFLQKNLLLRAAPLTAYIGFRPSLSLFDVYRYLMLVYRTLMSSLVVPIVSLFSEER